MIFKNTILLFFVVFLMVFPLVIKKGAEFGGSDDQAGAVIEKIDPSYKPWFSNIWEPPSGEIESLLFALQAAFGAGVVGYGVGYVMGKKKRVSE